LPSYVLQPYLKLGANLLAANDIPWLNVSGRLNPGFSHADTAAEFRLLASRQDRLNSRRKTTILVTDGSWFQEPGVRERPIWAIPLILGVLSLVLLIACANVATLLLSRAAGRHREIAVRLALGAGSVRLIRMLLAENFVLAATAGLLSVFLACRLPTVLFNFLMIEPATFPLAPDWRVFGYLAALTFLAALFSGLAPALEALNFQLSESLKGRQRDTIVPANDCELAAGRK
jgi:ABC-type antimicrobial peptide transport system permease subunit